MNYHQLQQLLQGIAALSEKGVHVHVLISSSYIRVCVRGVGPRQAQFDHVFEPPFALICPKSAIIGCLPPSHHCSFTSAARQFISWNRAHRLANGGTATKEQMRNGNVVIDWSISTTRCHPCQPQKKNWKKKNKRHRESKRGSWIERREGVEGDGRVHHVGCWCSLVSFQSARKAPASLGPFPPFRLFVSVLFVSTRLDFCNGFGGFLFFSFFFFRSAALSSHLIVSSPLTLRGTVPPRF